MTDIPKSTIVNIHERADVEALRAAAKAGYEGHAAVAQISDAVKKRDHQRAERERQAAKVHYLGTPPKSRR